MSAPLFVAIRCEELPARFVALGVEQLAKGLCDLLGNIEHGEVRTWATPRRIAVEIDAVADGMPLVERLVTGPPQAAAFRDGQPTRAAEGFARGKGVSVDDLEIVEGPRGPVIAARVKQGGQRTVDIVAAGLEKVVLGMRFPMTMRWRTDGAKWARPIHGVIALHGEVVVPACVAGINAGRSTVGHRRTPGPIDVSSASNWADKLNTLHVIADRDARRLLIEETLQAAAASAGSRLDLDDSLLEEVTDLVEWPVPVLCAFDPDLLHLPPRLLVESMRVHQKVFPLWRADGSLDHQFLTVSNHPQGNEPATADTIARGNAKVIGARFHDAKFFYAEDRRKRLDEHDHALARMQWIRKGGTVQDKAQRISRLSGMLAQRFGADQAVASRAGRLCKADLATQMVGEFPELQGHVGRLLAGFDGEPEGVPLAIEEHYLPRGSGDALPESSAGRAVAIADRLDTLAGCFATGIRIKGSNDPLGLRRAAHGLLQILLASQIRSTLPELFDLALDGVDHAVRRAGHSQAEDCDDLCTFTAARLRALLRDGHETEVVDAVLEAGGARDPVALQARVIALSDLAGRPEFGPLKTTFKRAVGLVKDHDDASYEPAALAHPAEQALHQALAAIAPEARQAENGLDYPRALTALAQLKAPVDALFDAVMVMDPDLEIRRHRLGLLRSVANAFHRVADFTQLSAD